MNAATAAEMRQLDERTIAERGISSRELMESAGLAVAKIILSRFAPARVAVFCGKGNNAGDGFVAARALYQQGIAVRVLCMEPESALKGDAAHAFAALAGTGIDIMPWPDWLVDVGNPPDIIVDALLGTGLRGTPADNYALAVKIINGAKKPVVAVDVPSGVGDDMGAEPAAVQATVTVTIGLPKVCLLTWPGAKFAGEVVVEPIQFPRDLLGSSKIRQNVATKEELLHWLPSRPGNANKGTFGKVGILAGSASYAGAAILCARGALRTGCGLAYMFSTPRLNAIYKAALPEAITVLSGTETDDHLGLPAAKLADEMQSRLDVLAVGPGLDFGDDQGQMLAQVLETWRKPLVLDASALTMLAEHKTIPKFSGRAVLTPHPGEMARMLGVKVSDVLLDRFESVRKMADMYEAVVVSKGASPLVCEPGGQVWIAPGAVPALAKGGTGDVLTGVIASFIAQGAKPLPATVLAVWAHLEAGKKAAISKGTRGVLASDVADAVPLVLDELEFSGEH